VTDQYQEDEWDLEESDFAGYIDDGEVYDAQVVSIRKVKKGYTDRETGEAVWRTLWRFKLISDDAHDGHDIYGETGVKLTPHPNCVFFNWVEAALGMNLPKGYHLKASTLTDRRCRVEIAKEDYMRDGQQKFHNKVRGVIPTREAMASMASQSELADDPF
jgi:hypothetical protein